MPHQETSTTSTLQPGIMYTFPPTDAGSTSAPGITVTTNIPPDPHEVTRARLLARVYAEAYAVAFEAHENEQDAHFAALSVMDLVVRP